MFRTLKPTGNQLCAKFVSIGIYAFRNITNQSFLPEKAFELGLIKVLKVSGI